jgi:hypothetical protein
VYDGDGGKAAVNPQQSLVSSITYSNGDKKVTIDLKHWTGRTASRSRAGTSRSSTTC